MFHPVGSQPPSVYWRRRFALLVSLVVVLVLLLLTVRVLLSDDPKSPSAAGGTGPASTPPASTAKASPRTSTSTSSSPKPTHTTTKTSGTPTATKTSQAPPKTCPATALSLAAVTSQSKYSVGDLPQLSIQVTNKGSISCVVDLADPQIVMRVYNGESRVWGSHDCKVEAGVDDRTLMAGSSVRVTIVWSGLSSQAKCAGSRERVGAGTYTLYASLAGHEGHAAQFTIS